MRINLKITENGNIFLDNNDGISSDSTLGRVGEHNATALRFSFFEELNGKFVSDFQKYLVVLFVEGEKSYPIDDSNEFEIPSELTESPELLIRVDLKKDEDVIFKTEPKLFTFADSDIVPPGVQKKHPLVGELDKLLTKNKENLVEAINEIYENGGQGGIDESVLADYVKKSEMPKVNVDDVVEKLSGTVNVYEPMSEGWHDSSTVAPTTGEISTDEQYSDFCVTPLIPVLQNTTYSLSVEPKNMMLFCYKENGEFCGYTLVGPVLSTGDEPTYHYGMTKPNTAYIRFVLTKSTDFETTVESFNSSFMLVKGMNMPSDYVAFDEGGYQFKENVYLSESRITEIAEKAVEIIDTALLPIIGSGVIE